MTRDGAGDLAAIDTARLDTPEWLMARWSAHYGEKTAHAIAAAHADPPPLDVSVKGDAEDWAARLRGRVLPTGTVRAQAHGPIARLPGFDEGGWWVQDAAAALPARLLGDVRGRTVADLCAAPGGKAAQLALAGADVTAVDRSPPRLSRLQANLARLGLQAKVVAADVAEWQGGPFDAVLLDAPCLSTGTIRRHPDVAWLKREADLAQLAALQTKLLDRAVELTKPGGTLVYCTCSLEPEEGENQIAALLERDSRVRRRPVEASEVAGLSEIISDAGDLRTLPFHLSRPRPPHGRYGRILRRPPRPDLTVVPPRSAAGRFAIPMRVKFSALPLAATRAFGYLSYLRADDGRPRQPRGTMSRGLIAERTRLSLFVLRRALRTFGGRMNGHPLLRWRFAYARPDRLLIAPQDLRTADSTRASEIYAGRFAFAGKIVTCDARSPFEMTPPSAEWAEGLLGFSWLRHLRAAESAITRSNARALVDDWITVQGAWDAVAWRPEIVARRIVSWLTHAPFLLHDADMRFYRRFMRSLTQQVRYLRRTTGDMRDGLPRLQGIIALNFAALCMAGQLRLLKSGTRKLVDELNRQVLPDGGHISRNPGALIDLLLDLLPLRQAFGARNIPPPQPLINAVDRMMPMLRFFRHGNGAFANFNGMGPTPLDVLATILAYDDARGRPVNNAAHSGYQRLEGSGSVLIMDSGAPPPMATSHEAHAGCLAFEFSTQSQRIIVNCGLPGTSRDSWRHLSRWR